MPRDKITPALQEEDGLAKQEAGERVGHDRETGENKETVGGDALQRVDLQVLVTASKFEFVASVHPAQTSRNSQKHSRRYRAAR